MAKTLQDTQQLVGGEPFEMALVNGREAEIDWFLSDPSWLSDNAEGSMGQRRWTIVRSGILTDGEKVELTRRFLQGWPKVQIRNENETVPGSDRWMITLWETAGE